MDRGAWWATQWSKDQTQLKRCILKESVILNMAAKIMAPLYIDNILNSVTNDI